MFGMSFSISVCCSYSLDVITYRVCKTRAVGPGRDGQLLNDPWLRTLLHLKHFPSSGPLHMLYPIFEICFPRTHGWLPITQT